MVKRNKLLCLILLGSNVSAQVIDTASSVTPNINRSSIVIQPMASPFKDGTYYAYPSQSWQSFVEQHRKLPKKYQRNGKGGYVTVTFLLTKNGKIRFQRVVGKRLWLGTSREAKRIVKLSEGSWWIEEKPNGKAKCNKGVASVCFPPCPNFPLKQ